MATADLKGAEYREAYGEAAWSQILGTYSMCLDKVYRFIIGVLIVFFFGMHFEPTKRKQRVPEPQNQLGFWMMVKFCEVLSVI